MRQAVRLDTANDQGVTQRESLERRLAKMGSARPEWAARLKAELEPVDVPWQVASLLRLFDALNNKRKSQVVSSMAGAMLLPEPLSSLELESHCRQRNLQLTPWEADTLDAMDLAYREESAKLRGKANGHSGPSVPGEDNGA